MNAGVPAALAADNLVFLPAAGLNLAVATARLLLPGTARYRCAAR
ncbi:hypothetical protein ABGB07_42450 [Micromonosporaceae bacterium B7E4]